MSYRWRYQTELGTDVVGPDVEFADQADAEEWLGRHYPDLLDGGVEQVTLLLDHAEVYGPMSLRPPS